MWDDNWLKILSPEYLLSIGLWKTFLPLPVTAAIISALVYGTGTWNEAFDERRGIYRVLIAFSALGLITGIVGGDSREPAVGAILPAVLSLVGGIAIYLIGKDVSQRVLVGLSIFCLSISLG